MLILFGVFLVCSYFIWPSKKRGKRQEDSWILETLIECLIEFPVEFIKFFLKGFLRFFGKIFDGFDIDL